MISLRGNNNVDSQVNPQTSKILPEDENDQIKGENLEEDISMNAVECIRRCDENEDFNLVFQDMLTTNIRPIPSMIRKCELKKSLNIDSASEESHQLEDLTENIALSSTFIEHKSSPLKLELSPIREDTLDDNLLNELIQDSTGDWYTIEQWKIQSETKKIPGSINGPNDSQTCLDLNGPFTCEKYYGSNDEMKSEKLTDKIYSSSNTYESLEELRTNITPKDDRESHSKLKNRKLLADGNNKKMYQTTMKQNENINNGLNPLNLKQNKNIDHYKNTEYYVIKNLVSNDVSIDNNVENDNRYVIENGTDFIVDSDFGKIRLNDESNVEVLTSKNRNIYAEKIRPDQKSLSENLIQVQSSRLPTIFSSFIHVSLSEDTAQGNS